MCSKQNRAAGVRGHKIMNLSVLVVGDSVGNFDCELVTSTLYGDLILNPSVSPSVKLSTKTSTSSNPFFYKKNYIYFVYNSVSIYQQNHSVGIPIELRTK